MLTSILATNSIFSSMSYNQITHVMSRVHHDSRSKKSPQGFPFSLDPKSFRRSSTSHFLHLDKKNCTRVHATFFTTRKKNNFVLFSPLTLVISLYSFLDKKIRWNHHFFEHLSLDKKANLTKEKNKLIGSGKKWLELFSWKNILCWRHMYIFFSSPPLFFLSSFVCIIEKMEWELFFWKFLDKNKLVE